MPHYSERAEEADYRECQTCDGTGAVVDAVEGSPIEWCPDCGGSGKEDGGEDE